MFIAPASSPPLSFRDHSVNAVLGHVHRAGVVSRSELARAVGLNRSSIARVLGELTQRGLIEAAGAARGGSRGRPSLLVQASPAGPVALAAQILPDAVVVAVGGLGGQLLLRRRHHVGTVGVAARTGELLGGLARRYAEQGVVSAVVAVRDADDEALHQHLAAALGGALPVRLVRVPDVAAVGEQRRGAGTGLRNVLYVTAQPHVAAGMVLDDQMFRGASGGAGRIAHLPVNPGGARCACGRRGCLDAEIGVSALLKAARSSGASVDERLDAALRAARDGDRRTVRAMDRIGGLLGAGLAQVMSILNPDAVVLGGYLGRSLPFLSAAITAALSATDGVPAPVFASALGGDAAVVGAIEVALQPLFGSMGGTAALADGPERADRVAG